MSAFTYDTIGGVRDVRPEPPRIDVRAVFVPHERLGPGSITAHYNPAPVAGHPVTSCSHPSWCKGRWGVVTVEASRVTHVWRCANERAAERTWRWLTKMVEQGLYPMSDAPARVNLGQLEAHVGPKGRLALPDGAKGASKPRRGKASAA